jgi:hypothetical protein
MASTPVIASAVNESLMIGWPMTIFLYRKIACRFSTLTLSGRTRDRALCFVRTCIKFAQHEQLEAGLKSSQGVIRLLAKSGYARIWVRAKPGHCDAKPRPRILSLASFALGVFLRGEETGELTGSLRSALGFWVRLPNFVPLVQHQTTSESHGHMWAFSSLTPVCSPDGMGKISCGRRERAVKLKCSKQKVWPSWRNTTLSDETFSCL